MRIVTVTNQTRGTLVASHVQVAGTQRTRMVGLLGRDSLAPGSGLWIRPSNGVHTVGMSFPIDVIGLDRQNRIVKLWPALPPWRLTSLSLRMQSAVELPAGTIAASSTQIGDTLLLSTASEPQA